VIFYVVLLTNCIFRSSLGWPLFSEWIFGWQDTALEYSWQESCSLEWTGRSRLGNKVFTVYQGTQLRVRLAQGFAVWLRLLQCFAVLQLKLLSHVCFLRESFNHSCELLYEWKICCNWNIWWTVYILWDWGKC
jgi:hypothetical protein